MPAASVDELRDFETQFDSLLASILASLATTHSLQLAGHSTTDVLTTPRLEYEFATDDPPATDNANIINPDTGAQLAFSGTITLRHVYDHTKVTAASAGALRGGLRTLFSPETGTITTSNLPYLEVVAFTEISAVRTRYKDEKEKLLTEFLLVFGLIWRIRDNAWPA